MNRVTAMTLRYVSPPKVQSCIGGRGHEWRSTWGGWLCDKCGASAHPQNGTVRWINITPPPTGEERSDG